MIDQAKLRRETARWYVLLALHNAQPVGAFEEILVATIQGLFADATQHEVRVMLDYLSSRELIALDKQPSGRWHAKLTRIGVDLVEYTVDCDPGIARPAK